MTCIQGISKTFGGSCTFAEMAARLVEENEGEEISLDKLCMHTRTKDGEWVDIRSKKIYDEYARCLELLGPNATKEDKKALFLECNPVEKKHRAFGLGSVASSLGSTGRSQHYITSDMFMQEDINKTVQAAEQIMQQQIEEQKKVTEDHIEEQRKAMEEQKKAIEEQKKATESLAAKLELFMGTR